MFGLALLIVTWLALTPQPPQLPAVSFADKWAHMMAFETLALLADTGWPERGYGPLKWGTLLAYGIGIELLQSQIPNRFFDPADALANAAGLILYGLVVLRVLRATGIR